MSLNISESIYRYHVLTGQAQEHFGAFELPLPAPVMVQSHPTCRDWTPTSIHTVFTDEIMAILSDNLIVGIRRYLGYP
jgi:hypothetical protein